MTGPQSLIAKLEAQKGAPSTGNALVDGEIRNWNFAFDKAITLTRQEVEALVSECKKHYTVEFPSPHAQGHNEGIDTCIRLIRTRLGGDSK